ncbi:MAG: hypothetical protein ACI4RT_05335 [Candidatus Spyradenecus sp.]
MITPQASETYPANHPIAIQRLVRDRLAADPYYAQHRVAILLQDEGEMKTLIDQKTLILKGPILVICINTIAANGCYTDAEGNQTPAYEMTLELICTEQVVTNRSRAGFDTALGVVFHAAEAINGEDFRLDNIRHFIDGEGLFQAVATFTLICY